MDKSFILIIYPMLGCKKMHEVEGKGYKGEKNKRGQIKGVKFLIFCTTQILST